MTASVMAIDSGSVNVGWAVAHHSGVIHAPKGADLGWRLKIINEGIRNQLHIFKPAIVLIEVPDPFAQRKSPRGWGNQTRGLRGILTLSEAVGVIRLAAEEIGAEVNDISPQTWKGNAMKKSIQLATGIDQPDQADAVGILQWYERIGQRIIAEGIQTTRRRRAS